MCESRSSLEFEDEVHIRIVGKHVENGSHYGVVCGLRASEDCRARNSSYSIGLIL